MSTGQSFQPNKHAGSANNRCAVSGSKLEGSRSFHRTQQTFGDNSTPIRTRRRPLLPAVEEATSARTTRKHQHGTGRSGSVEPLPQWKFGSISGRRNSLFRMEERPRRVHDLWKEIRKGEELHGQACTRSSRSIPGDLLRLVQGL